jgi:hypothetical protein
MFLLVCGMGSINCTGEEINWELMLKLKKVPAILKERCEGKLSITVDDVSGEDCITLVTSHTCSHKCPLVQRGEDDCTSRIKFAPEHGYSFAKDNS